MRLTDFLQEFGESVEEEKGRQAKMNANKPPRKGKRHR
nr:MAG TPA_asm: hypothetical protein [Caudoviricetes sp.]